MKILPEAQRKGFRLFCGDVIVTLSCSLEKSPLAADFSDEAKAARVKFEPEPELVAGDGRPAVSSFLFFKALSFRYMRVVT